MRDGLASGLMRRREKEAAEEARKKRESQALLSGILGTVGTVIGGAIGGPAGAAIGGTLGKAVGGGQFDTSAIEAQAAKGNFNISLEDMFGSNTGGNIMAGDNFSSGIGRIS